MEATIIKNDEFKTIGLVVKHAKVEIFSWGITCPDFYFSKTINADEHMADIMRLVHLQQECRYREHEFHADWFGVATDEKNDGRIKIEGGVHFTESDEKCAQRKKTIKHIIERIK